MITLKEFKEGLNWSMLELHPQQVKDVYNAIDAESIRSLDELRFREEEGELEDAAIYYDKGFVAALENLIDIHESMLVDLINTPYGERVDLHYIAGDDMYAVIYYAG